MRQFHRIAAMGALSLAMACPAVIAQAQVPTDQDVQPGEKTSFFITSVGVGDGANLGGLDGADAHCTKLAEAAGYGGRTWRAYLSTVSSGNRPSVNARDRIGAGPWYNVKGIMIAQNLGQLHGDTMEEALAGSRLFILYALDENGNQVNTVGSTPLKHDILTGSRSDGRAYTNENEDTTCSNWTSNSDGKVRLGHHDRTGVSTSWNSAHWSRNCSQEGLVATGGAGLFYCFATDAQ